MSTWQILVLFALAGCALGCLLAIYRAIDRLAKGLVSVGSELKRMNGKLESIEAVDKDEPKRPMDQVEPELEALEAAISQFEKLKRVDLANP